MYAADCRGVPDGQQKFSTLPTYLPVAYQVQNAELSFFLKETGQEVMRNGSLQSRAEPFFIHLADGAPSVNCSYGNLSAESPVPLELLQASPPLLPAATHMSFNWKVRAHVVIPRASARNPRLQVLFYLAGRRWDEAPVPEVLLPCVHLEAQLDGSEVAASCRLEGGLGICVAELELPPAWFGAAFGRRKPGASSAELFYTVQPLEGAAKGCGAKDIQRGRNHGSRKGPAAVAAAAAAVTVVAAGAQRIGTVELVSSQDEGPPLTSLPLDENVEIEGPAGPVRQGQTITFRVNVSSASTVEQFILRITIRAAGHDVVSLTDVLDRPGADLRFALRRTRHAKCQCSIESQESKGTRIDSQRFSMNHHCWRMSFFSLIGGTPHTGFLQCIPVLGQG
ncbi:hypothetical protein Z043_118016, partial [Scleropages formosus]